MPRNILLLATLLAAVALQSPAFGQRGMGDSQGIARQAIRPPIVDLTGIVQEVKIETCAMTTGRAAVGAHVMIQADSGGTPINLHLGPEAALSDLLALLQPGESLSSRAFRTDAMPTNALVAQSVMVNGQNFVLRDETLRPNWQIGPRGPGRGQGMGQGPGQGPGQGMGRGQGTGMGPGQGAGSGSMPGHGRCWW